MSRKYSLSEINSLRDDQFEVLFGNVIELYDAAAKSVKNERPFKSTSDICDTFYKYLEEISVEEKLKILKLHPDLAGRLASQGALTPESAKEQRSAGLQDITPEQKALLDESNEKYKLRFGFPFIICARENKVQSIISGLQSRNKNTQEEEINTGINEVKKICRLRILDIVSDD